MNLTIGYLQYNNVFVIIKEIQGGVFMEKSKSYDIYIYIALFVMTVSLTVTYKTQLDMKKEIAALTSKYTEYSEITFTARENIVDDSSEGGDLTETAQETPNSETNEPKSEKTVKTTAENKKSEEIDSTLIVNTKSKKIHSSTCSYATNMKEENKEIISSDKLNDYINNGYSICMRCNACK